MREFPDALIEKAARALYEAPPADHFADWDNTDRDIREVYRREARAVLTAVTPAIQATALRDAAESPECRTQRDYEWLNERADRIHPKEDPDA